MDLAEVDFGMPHSVHVTVPCLYIPAPSTIHDRGRANVVVHFT